MTGATRKAGRGASPVLSAFLIIMAVLVLASCAPIMGHREHACLLTRPDGGHERCEQGSADCVCKTWALSSFTLAH